MASKAPTGCVVAWLAFLLVFGGWSVNYCLNVLLQKDIPFVGDILIGLFAGSITIPLAIVLWILSLFGVTF
jgi:hypothetical protein